MNAVFSLLIPLGLIGLLGVLALIIIYLIKPNYLTRNVSSTFVWKLSLKYRKKRVPVSKLRNILLFICQVLILVAMAFILAQPAIVHETKISGNDVIAIIDSSASMYAQTMGETRFHRAVDKAATLIENTLDGGGYGSVIIADDAPEYLFRRASASDSSQLDMLYDLNENEYACSYSRSDLDEAMKLTSEIIAENPETQIYVYTDTQFDYLSENKNVHIESVTDSGEWNAAILNAQTDFVDGMYLLRVQVACYGADRELEVNVRFSGAISNYDLGEQDLTFSKQVFCNAGSVKTVVFSKDGGQDNDDVLYYAFGDGSPIYAFNSINVSIDVDDALDVDDNFYVYGGQREMIKVQYYSTDPNVFVPDALDQVVNLHSKTWNIQVTEVKEGGAYSTEGFDLYIFEHFAPRNLPTDGAVILLDPNIAPTDSGFRIEASGGDQRSPVNLIDAGSTSPAMTDVMAELIRVSYYSVVTLDPSFEVCMKINNDPAFFVRNDKERKLAVLPFSVHYSNIIKLPEWFYIFDNLFSYFIPTIADSYYCEVNGEMEIDTRGERMTVTYASGESEAVSEFPFKMKFTVPGTYTLSQTTYYGKSINPVKIFVNVPSSESDIWAHADTLSDPFESVATTDYIDDLLLWIAAVLVALLFAEWLLKSRDN